MHELILVADFGSQYTQLIARRIRECNIYCEIYPYNQFPKLNKFVKGVILSGSPSSVRDPGAPFLDLSEIRKKVPVLGICYGAQLMAFQNKGEVSVSGTREYGRALLKSIDENSNLFRDINPGSTVWMSHGDSISKVPDNFTILASTSDVPVAAYQITGEQTFALQFHPEVTHSSDGKKILKNFVIGICKCSGDWTASSFVEEKISELKSTLGNDRVVLGLSGGVDSSVAAALLHKAIGTNLHCIFVDNGLLRKNEFESVLESYKHLGLNITGVNAKEIFYIALKNLTDPEEKRKAIGKTFIEIFDKEAHRIKNVNWLGQGTIYPDVIESVNVKGPSATIKSHHNVGGLPEKMNLKVIEPLKSLFKDEVRAVGSQLKLDQNILNRHPFPGPGLAIRILGEITPEKVTILQEADDIFISLLKKHKLYEKVWQAGVILLPVLSVAVSAYSGDGLGAWYSWLREALAALKAPA